MRTGTRRIASLALFGLALALLPGCGMENPVAPQAPAALETSTVELAKRHMPGDTGIGSPEGAPVGDQGGTTVPKKVKKPKKPKKNPRP